MIALNKSNALHWVTFLRTISAVCGKIYEGQLGLIWEVCHPACDAISESKNSLERGGEYNNLQPPRKTLERSRKRSKMLFYAA